MGAAERLSSMAATTLPDSTQRPHTRPLRTEQRAGGTRVRAVVHRIEALEQARDALARRAPANSQRAGRGAELEEYRFPLGGNRDRPLEVFAGARCRVRGRDIHEQTLAPEAMELVLDDTLARLPREGERRVQHRVRARDVATREMGAGKDRLPGRGADTLVARSELREAGAQRGSAFLHTSFLNAAPAEKHRGVDPQAREPALGGKAQRVLGEAARPFEVAEAQSGPGSVRRRQRREVGDPS